MTSDDDSDEDSVFENVRQTLIRLQQADSPIIENKQAKARLESDEITLEDLNRQYLVR